MANKKIIRLKLSPNQPSGSRGAVVSESEDSDHAPRKVSSTRDYSDEESSEDDEMLDDDVDEVEDNEEEDEDDEEIDEEDDDDNGPEDDEEDDEEKDEEEEANSSLDEFDMDDSDSGINAAPTRTTARQRSQGKTETIALLPSMNSRSKKKVLSAEEQRIQRAELARRRKNLSDQRLEEEKQDTLDKLLRKRAGRSKKGDLEDQEIVPKSRLLPPSPAFISYNSSAEGSKLSFSINL